jgi:hypothetical protein
MFRQVNGREWNMGENKSYTCQNPSCRKCFTSPLKAVNLRQNPQETYYACPYCLTKILTIEESLKPALKKSEPEIEDLLSKTKEKERKEKQKGDKKANCNYHPGYLSERSSNQPIPDECLVCKDILNCMLKKMRE